MSNIKDSEKATVASRITDKTVDYSIAKQDLGTTFDEIIDLLGAVLVNEDLTYPVGFVVYTASPYAIYACKVEDADGDVTNQTNWLKIAGSGLPYLVADTEVEISIITGASGSNYYIAFPILLSSKAGVFFDLRITGVSATNSGQVGYGITIDTTGSIEGSSVLIKTDNNGVGMSTLLVDGLHSERLEAGATYMFTRTTDVQDTDGYILTKIGTSGIKILSTGTSFIASTGKYIVVAGGSFVLPLAASLGGESIEVLLASAGSFVPTLSGSDTIVNIGALAYTRPLMKYTSDGVDKWYLS